MNTRPEISIITPTHNRRQALERALRSVLSQTEGRFEYLIVDDGSDDGTAEFIQHQSDPRIRFLRLEQWRGANAARNLGIEHARSDWVTFLDSDDEFMPHRVETLLSRIHQVPCPELLISSFHTHKNGSVREATNPEALISGGQLERGLMAYALSIAGSGITASRKLLVQAGGFAPQLMRLQDRDLLLRLSQYSGAQLLNAPDWIKHHSIDSISGPRRGYIESVDRMLALHPRLASRYRHLLSYHVSRHLLRDLVRMNYVEVYRSWRSSRTTARLCFNVRELIAGYRHGKLARKKVVHELKAQTTASAATETQSIPRPTAVSIHDPGTIPC